MRRCWFLSVILIGALNGDLTRAQVVESIAGYGTTVPAIDPEPCYAANLWKNHDGFGEGAFAWRGAGVASPDWGAVAEGYEEYIDLVCGIQLLLTHWGEQTGEGTIDLYVWTCDAEHDAPGAVLSLTTGVVIRGVAEWPLVSTYNLDSIDSNPGAEGCFVGYWPASAAGGAAPFGVAVDTNSFAGVPRTHVAPGLGYPSGWQDPRVLDHPCVAFGIGMWTVQPVVGPLDPVANTSWGMIKRLYR